MADEKKVIPTMGYKPGLRSQVFELGEGEKLPPGWSPTIPKGEHPHEIEIAQANKAAGASDADLDIPAALARNKE